MEIWSDEGVLREGSHLREPKARAKERDVQRVDVPARAGLERQEYQHRGLPIGQRGRGRLRAPGRDGPADRLDFLLVDRAALQDTGQPFPALF